MEGAIGWGEYTEVAVQHELFHGTADLLTPDPDRPGCYILADYKTYGAYKAGKVAGLTYDLEMSDTEVYKRSGRLSDGTRYYAGQPKYVKKYFFDESLREIENESFQLNTYRVGLEDRFPIFRMQLYITIRNWTLRMENEGFPSPFMIVDVPFIKNEYILERAQHKQSAFKEALDKGKEPEKCSDDETWAGVRCQSYCEVRHLCPYAPGD